MNHGIHPNTTYEQYEAALGLRSSELKALQRSPLHFIAREPAESPALRLGTAAHCATLEPDRFLAEYAVWDRKTDSGRSAPRNGKWWDAFVEDNKGRTIATEDEHRHAVAISRAVRADPTAAKYLRNGAPEVTMLWDFPGPVAAKARVDWLTTVNGVDVLVGLKTTRDCRQGPFGAQAAKLGYHLQWAWYHDGFRLLTGRTPKMVEIVVESARPYAVATYHIPDDIIGQGRDEYEALLALLADCVETNYWPGPVSGEVDLTYPLWAYGDGEIEITNAED